MISFVDARRHARALNKYPHLQEMLTPTSKLPGSHTNYGYWFGGVSLEVRGKTMIGHTGDIDGSVPRLAIFRGRCHVIVSQTTITSRAWALRRFAGIALGAPYLEASATVLSATQRRQLAGAYQVDPQTLLTLSDKTKSSLRSRATGDRTAPDDNSRKVTFCSRRIDLLCPARDAFGSDCRA